MQAVDKAINLRPMQGPLQQLFGDLQQPESVETVHPKVLSFDNEQGRILVFVVWKEADIRQIHLILRQYVEAELMRELLTRTDSVSSKDHAPLAELRLACFAEIPELQSALAAFGFRAADQDTSWRPIMSHLRGEQSTLGLEQLAPQSLWVSPLETTSIATGIEAKLRASSPRSWGQPAGYAAWDLCRAAQLPSNSFDAFGQEAYELLPVVESLIVPDTFEQIRWIPPNTFLALCDWLGVAALGIASARDSTAISWALAERKPQPLLLQHAGRQDGSQIVDLGVEILRWCIMPKRKHEQIPPLQDWLQNRFA